MDDVPPNDRDALLRLRQYVNHDKGRYYATWVQQDLFGTWCVMRVWGGSGSRLGRIVTTPMPDLERCIGQAAREDKRRRQRGYTKTV